ncbi:MAG: DEAD/DEAH box helicase family protein [Pseudoxanthomonas sp.]|nr:DEAD/DEAH box helicase family protein [Pseudoxanthomonas sp.]
MELRPYQAQALETLWRYLRNADGNPALVLPTGAGKSPLMAAIATEAVANWNGRVGILAHVQELVEQNAAKLHAYAPDADVGIYAAGLRQRDRFNKILVMQIQSVAEIAHQLGRFDLLLVDEAHRIPLNGEGRYRTFIDACRKFNPDLRVVGLTATPYRLQGQAVPVCGPDYLLSEVAYEARVGDLIRDGYLSRLISRPGATPDLSGIHTRGGEYVEAELSAAMRAGGLVQRTVADVLERAQGRSAGIVFCVDVAHAEEVLFELMDRGETAAIVHQGTKKAERRETIAQYQAGVIRWMVNVNVLSEGFDAPHIDCVVMLRPTKSPGLYYQQVGRGFRLAPGKDDCLVLDYAGNVLEHGPVDAIRVRRERPGKAAAVETTRAKECPQCTALLALGVRECPECGHTFGSLDPSHLDRPVDAPVLSAQQERRIATHAVRSVAFERWPGKSGKPPTLRATYQCGLRRFSEWLCFEHAGMARANAMKWWQERSSAQPPRTVEEAMAAVYALPVPTEIVVDETDKYPRILSAAFAAVAAVEVQAGQVDKRAPAWLRNAIGRAA